MTSNTTRPSQRTAAQIADHLIASEPEFVRGLLIGLIIDCAYLHLKEQLSYEDAFEATEWLLGELWPRYAGDDEARAIAEAAGLPIPDLD